MKGLTMRFRGIQDCVNWWEDTVLTARCTVVSIDLERILVFINLLNIPVLSTHLHQ
jgi:hypothetical protein